MRIATLLTMLCLFAATTTAAQTSEWTSLLDEDLSEWRMYLGYKFTTAYNGDVPTDENGNPIDPIGYDKNVNDVYTVIEEDGEPVLRISGEYYGSVSTLRDFENYHLTLQVRWGDTIWPPRQQLLKDSGILYHSVGEHGVDYWRAWQLSQEFQVMDGHIGDFWTIANSAIDIRAFPEEGAMSPVASLDEPFLSFGPGGDQGGYCLRTVDYEKPEGAWNTLELIAFEDKALHIVNGHVVMVLQNSRYVEDGEVHPLTHGAIQLQSEAAEVFYKDVRIRSIETMPAEYAHLFD